MIPKKTAVNKLSKTVNKAKEAAIVAITAVKKTVAPIPAYLVFSPEEHWYKISVSEPEQKTKKRCNMM